MSGLRWILLRVLLEAVQVRVHAGAQACPARPCVHHARTMRVRAHAPCPTRLSSHAHASPRRPQFFRVTFNTTMVGWNINKSNLAFQAIRWVLIRCAPLPACTMSAAPRMLRGQLAWGAATRRPPS